MNPLEERIAEAAQRAFDYTPSDDVWGDVARAVVAVLPTADVSDAQIGMALSSTTLCAHGENRDPFDTCRYCIGDDAVGTVRALLDAQAAAFAASLPTADVSDVRRFYVVESVMGGSIMVDDPQGGLVMYDDHAAALDAQAAAHAAEVEALRAQIDRDRIRGAEAVLTEQLRTSTAEAEYEAEKISHNETYAKVEALRKDVRIEREALIRECQRTLDAEAEVEALRADNVRLDRALHDITSTADRAVREALIRAETEILSASYSRLRAEQPAMRLAADLVRSLIPEGDTE